jgi:hypothetical protein
LQDNFGSQSAGLWNEAIVSDGEAVTISTDSKSQDEGVARFTTDGQSTGLEYAYLAKTIDVEEAYARGEFRIIGANYSQLLKDDGDTIYLMRFANEDESLALAGVRREAGVNKWTLEAGGSFKTASEVFTDQWYIVELHYNALQGIAQMFVDGQKILQIDVITTNLNIEQFDFGIVSATNIQDELIIYADSVKLLGTHKVLEGKIKENLWTTLIPIISLLSFGILLTLFRKPIFKTSKRLRYHGIMELKRMAEETLILCLNLINQFINKISSIKERINKRKRKSKKNKRY